MGFTQSHCQTAVQTSIGHICLQIETKEFCIVQKNESRIPSIGVVVVNCQTLKITFNRN